MKNVALSELVDELDMFSVNMSLSCELLSHINGYFDRPPKDENDARYIIGTLSTLCFVLSDRLFEEKEKLNKLVRGFISVENQQ